MSLEELQPAGKADVILYAPYYQKNKHNWLPYAIALYQKGSLEGNRGIENSESIPFIATWYVSKLPAEMTICRLQFDGQADLSYEVKLSNAEFMDYLIDVFQNFKRSGGSMKDFPQTFYRKLLRFE